jgi:hypothetical protein
LPKVFCRGSPYLALDENPVSTAAMLYQFGMINRNEIGLPIETLRGILVLPREPEVPPRPAWSIPSLPNPATDATHLIARVLA